MIITRTPFRISFAGGGTDLAAFYRREPGAVVSTAIKKYMYITVNRRFDSTIRVSYARTEIMGSVAEIQHPIVREALRLTGITGGIEIVSIADIPAGTGLGSSSSFTVGLLNALYAYKGHLKSAAELAEQACQIEIDILGEPLASRINISRRTAAYATFSSTRTTASSSIPSSAIAPARRDWNAACCCSIPENPTRPTPFWLNRPSIPAAQINSAICKKCATWRRQRIAVSPMEQIPKNLADCCTKAGGSRKSWLEASATTP